MEHAAPTTAVEHAGAESSHVLYGDSSPFPYGLDFLEGVRGVVDCCVALLHAQAAIDGAGQEVRHAEQRAKTDRAGFDRLLIEVQQATARFLGTPSRLTEAAVHVVAAAQARVEHEQEHLVQKLAADTVVAHRSIDEACAAAYEAIEALLLRHVPPDSSVGWRLLADEEGYDGRVILGTRFGLEALFGIACPESHPFARPRRVSELSAGTTARLPRGNARRPNDTRLVALDRFFVSEAAFDPERVGLVLRARPRAGAGYRFEVQGATEQVYVQVLDEAGQAAGEVVEIDADEREAIVALSSAALDQTFDLVLRRQLLVGASLDGQSLRERFQPRDLCARLIDAYAPIVNEIALRSGPPGELMLRRDLGNGRREAVFVQRAELRQKLLSLPQPGQRLLAAFGI